jgi:hypothetical protein
MASGPIPHPQVTLNPKLRLAVLRAISEGRTGSILSLMAGFQHHSRFSSQLHAKVFAATPLTIERFTRLAAIVGFDGELFQPARTNVLNDVPDPPHAEVR